MGLFNNFRTGVRTYKEAHRFIVRHKLWFYVFLPGIINAGMIALLIFGGWQMFGSVTDWLLDLLGLSKDPTGLLKFLAVFLQVLFRIVFYVILFFVYFMVFRYLVLIILSPLLAIVSEKTEKLLTGKEYPFRLGYLIKDVLRGVGVATRNLFVELTFLIVLFFLSYIPVIGYICPVLIFFITCYYYGFSMMDYSNERYRLSIRQSARFVRKNRGFAMANGMIFYLVFFFVPLIGFVVAPAYAVIAATLGVHHIRAKEAVVMKVQSK
jgi:CysZ protein